MGGDFVKIRVAVETQDFASVRVAVDEKHRLDRGKTMLDRIFKNVKNHMHRGRHCPGPEDIGDCAVMNFIHDDLIRGKSKVYIAPLYIWDESFTDAEQVANWFLEAGAETAVVRHVLYDSENGDRDGFTPEGSRAWDVVFSISKAKLAAHDSPSFNKLG